MHYIILRIAATRPLYGYFPKPSKSYLVIKEQYLENAIETFRGSVVKITTEGKKHLGATIRSEDFKASYVKSLVDNWHNDLGDITANLLSHVCNNVEIKPKLLPVTGECFSKRTTNTRTEARLDTRSRRFWVRGQQTFFDVKIFDLNAKRYLNLAHLLCYTQNEKEKKRQYNERVLQIEHENFTPFVFSIYGGMSREWSTFYNRFSNLLSEKRDKLPLVKINLIRTKISFSPLKSCLFCLRGTRGLN